MIKTLRYFSKIMPASNHISFSNMVLQERKINVDNYNINYLDSGQGGHVLLCLPGVAGTIWTDFSKQIHGFDKKKFRLIVWDPPGYGNSRPPKRNFSIDYLSIDANTAAALMMRLNIKHYSVLGWSDGGITGLFLASRYPSNVNKLVIWGANAYVTPDDVVGCKYIGEIENWSPAAREPMEKIYGLDELKEIMTGMCNAINAISTERDGDICREEIGKIKAPTFILHGAKDPLIGDFHVRYLHKHITNSRLYIFGNGKHNIHIRYADEFNEIVQDFLEDDVTIQPNNVKSSV